MRMHAFCAIVACAAMALLASCAAVRPPANSALTDASGFESPKPYRLGLVKEGRGNSDELLVLVAISGGGKRSSAFSYGVLAALNDARIDGRPLLREIDVISGVSGGAFTAAYYALHREAMFANSDLLCSYENAFLYEDYNAYIWGLYLLPWRMGWMVDADYGSNDLMAKIYAERLFRKPAAMGACPDHDPAAPYGATFADLYELGPPVLIVGATDIAKGTVFPFSQDSFDLICSDLSTFPIAWAVAASGGFAPLLSSIGLRNHHASGRCQPVGNRWLAAIEAGDCEAEATNAPIPDVRNFGRDHLLGDLACRYLYPPAASYAHAADGGITDNLALRALADWAATHREGQDLARLGNTKRILVLVIDGQSSLSPKLAESEIGPDFFDALNATISSTIDQYNVETLIEMQQQLGEMAKAISDYRDPSGKLTVDYQLMTLTIAEDSDSQRSARLREVETGLTIPAPDVTDLIAAGRDVACRHLHAIGVALNAQDGVKTAPSARPCPDVSPVTTR